MNEVLPVRVLAFWSFVPEWWSRIIVRVTGRQLPDQSDAFSHCGILFAMSDGSMEYFEALFSEGFSGPKPYAKLLDKIDKSKGRLYYDPLEISDKDAREVYARCMSWVGRRGYYGWQLALMWWFERIGKWVGWEIPASEAQGVCSEDLARAVFPWVDLRDAKHRTFDAVNPNSAYRKWLKIKGGKL